MNILTQALFSRSRKRERNHRAACGRKVNFSECCNISDSTTSRTSAAAIEFIIMHLCRLKLILEARVSGRIRAAGSGDGGDDSAEIPRLNSRS